MKIRKFKKNYKKHYELIIKHIVINMAGIYMY